MAVLGLSPWYTGDKARRMATNSDYATKADLRAIRDELINAIRQSESNLRNEMTELIRDTETKLLNAFYSFAEATQKHLSENERGIHGVGERLTLIERRVTDIEKRLNFPPSST